MAGLNSNNIKTFLKAFSLIVGLSTIINALSNWNQAYVTILKGFDSVDQFIVFSPLVSAHSIILHTLYLLCIPTLFYSVKSFKEFVTGENQYTWKFLTFATLLICNGLLSVASSGSTVLIEAALCLILIPVLLWFGYKIITYSFFTK